MQVLHSVQAMEIERRRWTGQVGFVPTMGYLHEGHLSLCRRARAENQALVVSIFVNPAQFNSQDDLAHYPQDLERDQSLLESLGVDVVFVPTAEEMYPPHFTTYVEPVGSLITQAEGAFRPGHFRGVATIVLKLCNLIQPLRVYMGQKDAQQLAVISCMIRDFHLPIQLLALPTIREVDGLAMSSRNAHLDPLARQQATRIYAALAAGRAAFEHSPASALAVTSAMAAAIAAEPALQLEYAEVCDPLTFQPLETLRAPAVLAVAAKLGPIRLIDNFLLRADGSWDTGTLISDLAHLR